MRSWLGITLSMICIVGTLIFTIYYAYQFYITNQADQFQSTAHQEKKYRIMFIAAEQNVQFWSSVQKKAMDEAEKQGVSIQFRNSVRPSEDEIIKQMEMAIAARVDGMIVHGMDSPRFVEVVNKASARGIPVITVFTDAPSSLRKAYVGADHFVEGYQMAQMVAKAVNYNGAVSILYDKNGYNYQKERLSGLMQAFSSFPNIHPVEAQIEADTSEGYSQKTKSMLNQGEQLRAVIGLSS